MIATSASTQSLAMGPVCVRWSGAVISMVATRAVRPGGHLIYCVRFRSPQSWIGAIYDDISCPNGFIQVDVHVGLKI